MTRLTTLFFLCLPITASAQSLFQINSLRNSAVEHFKAGRYDSSRYYFSKVIKDTTFSDATDHLQLASGYLHLQDSGNFKKHLLYSIEKGGADTGIIFTYFRTNNESGQDYLRQFLGNNFKEHRAKFLATIDTGLQRELDDILYLDQLPRGGGMSQTNFPHIKHIGRYVDSVNYLRVVSLIERGKYPGFHNYGIMSSKYDVVLMHITDHSEDAWNYIFSFLKKQVLAGNITTKQVVSIATRHYQTQKCTYYGSVKKWGAATLCNCEEVDKYRTEIGMETLGAEYRRLGEKLPDCYKEK